MQLSSLYHNSSAKLRQITPPSFTNLAPSYLKKSPHTPVTTNIIIEFILHHYPEITPEMIKGKLRHRKIAEARQMLAYLIYNYSISCPSLNEVAQPINRDH